MSIHLYKGETLYDHTNDKLLIGDGKHVHACGDVRLLARTPPKPGSDRRSYAADFAESFPLIPRNEWRPRIKDQLQGKRRVSDIEKWSALDQNGTPQCWSNGVAGAAATCRVIQGLPYIQLSPASIACPISNGTSGGNEEDAVQYGMEHGWAPSCIFPQHATGRSLLNDPKVIESRKHFMLLEVYDCGDSWDKMGSALLQGFVCLAAFPDWSHVTEVCELVDEDVARGRNSWSDSWGGKNEAGFGGYYSFRENSGPHCRPSGIFAIRQMTPHTGTEYLGP